MKPETKDNDTPVSILAEIEAIATAVANIANIVAPIINAFTVGYKATRKP